MSPGDHPPEFKRFAKRLERWAERAKTWDSNVSKLIRIDGQTWTVQWVKGKMIAKLRKTRS